VLLKNGNNEGAYYLTGLAVECAFKAAIARRTQRHDFPPDPKYLRESVYVHKLDTLLVAAYLDEPLKTAATSNPVLRANWALVKGWRNESRYDLGAASDARSFYQAVVSRNGVMSWLRQYW
jgi:hypothetical protein